MTASPIDRNALGDGDGVLASGVRESGREQGAGNRARRWRDGGSRAGDLFVGETHVMALVDAAGDVAGEYRYGPYGQTRTAAETGIANPFRFSTKFPETAFATENEHLAFGNSLDLYDYGFRWYHAGLGRWTARDADRKMVIFSQYDLVGNNPVCVVDILGLREGRRPDRRRIMYLGLFDDRGAELLEHWLGGTGTPIVANGGEWGEYMRSNELLREQMAEQLIAIASTKQRTHRVDNTLHAEIENGYSTGYQMLHGTHRGVGDFEIDGYAIVEYDKPNCSYKVTFFRMKYTWNDVIDPNATYKEDVWLSWFLDLFWDPSDYSVHLSWEADVSETAEVVIDCSGDVRATKGYPFESSK